MEHPKDICDRTVLAVMLALQATGHDVLVPFGENTRYCPETGGVYLVPIDNVPTRCSAALRVDRPRNGQAKRIRFAADYEIARIPVARTS